MTRGKKQSEAKLITSIVFLMPISYVILSQVYGRISPTRYNISNTNLMSALAHICECRWLWNSWYPPLISIYVRKESKFQNTCKVVASKRWQQASTVRHCLCIGHVFVPPEMEIDPHHHHPACSHLRRSDKLTCRSGRGWTRRTSITGRREGLSTPLCFCCSFCRFPSVHSCRCCRLTWSDFKKNREFLNCLSKISSYKIGESRAF